MSYPVSIGELRQSPHGSVSKTDRLRLALLGFTAEASDEGVAVKPHPVYRVDYTGDTEFLLGENGPLRFEISRKDGRNVAAPTTATLTILLPEGTAATITPDVESSAPAITMVLSADYLFALRGLYTIKLLTTIGTEIVGIQRTLVCHD
jgi:hypothetical protein